MNPWDLLEKASARAHFQAESVGICLGHMANAIIDLESGETTATAIRTLQRGMALIDERNAPMRELAIAIEAQRAATENTGAVHESADPKGIAQ